MSSNVHDAADYSDAFARCAAAHRDLTVSADNLVIKGQVKIEQIMILRHPRYHTSFANIVMPTLDSHDWFT